MKRFVALLAFFVSFFLTSSAFLGFYDAKAQIIVQDADGLKSIENATDEAKKDATVSSEMRIVPKEETRADLTVESEETIEPLVRLLKDQKVGSPFFSPLKYAIRNSINAGVPANTIVLLLMLPGVAALIAAIRHFIGIRGFGIFLPAALSVVFVATGPVVGILLFLVIVVMSTAARIILRKIKVKLQYLPRMALLLLVVVLGILGVLFAAPVIQEPALANVSIFPVLILVLLAEDFSKVQLGKSAKTAVNLTTETLILALLSYIFLTLKPVQEIALLHPEGFIMFVFVFDIIVGRYIGLRLIEFWRFRKLISD
ncbi:hypothetical protein JXA63_00310 [Candidatus Woesebacteria bacterium]|nr:hypothetical protein [Candidatus Woesebacteria bacterium]